tara:strand:+ start:63 stop:443 length:381 start_codon:yes stop_codon:yes gene_type:complete
MTIPFVLSDMSKMKKILESSLKNLVLRDILNLNEVESSKLANMLADEIVDDLKSDEVSESYLNRYSTVRLVSMIKNLITEEIKDDNVEMALHIITILNQRFREYNLLTGDDSIKVEAKEVDKVLFP